ncbi:hypothetical protein PFISCL1PPCAC_10800, partial [Pristionchus fissidentatus]
MRSGWRSLIYNHNTRLVELSENVSLAEDGVFLVLESHLCSSVLGEKHAISGLDRVGDELALLGTESRTGGDDGGFENLALRFLGEHDSSLGLDLSRESLDQNTVVERLEGLQQISILKTSDSTEHGFFVKTTM